MPDFTFVYCSKALKVIIFSQGQKWPIIHGCGDVLVVLASSQFPKLTDNYEFSN